MPPSNTWAAASRVALIPFGFLFEDFLDSIGVSLEAFSSEMTGGWLFGYVEALQLAGWRVTVLIFTARVAAPRRTIHRPTGAEIVLLPAPRGYLRLRKLLQGRCAGATSRLERLATGTLGQLAPYCSTPLRALVRELQQGNYAAILCQEYEFPRFDVCCALGMLLRRPIFATYQGGNYQRFRAERWLRPLSLRMSAGLIVASRVERQRLRKHYRLPARKIHNIANPIDLTHWPAPDRAAARAALGLPLGARIVAWHGRVVFTSKALDVLVDAWTSVCRRRPGGDLRLILLGTGPDAAELERRLQATGLRNVIWHNRYIHDRELMRTYLSAADIYAFPSRHEGFPVAPIEAMACGLAIVAADADGIGDILEGGENSGGMIVPREDVEQLAEALGQLIDDEQRTALLGRRARQRVEACYSLSSIGARLANVLTTPETRPVPRRTGI